MLLPDTMPLSYGALIEPLAVGLNAVRRVGLRPGTPDNLPAIGRAALEGLWWATGHYRNGILLTPLTADLLTGALAGEESEMLGWCDPARFATADGAAHARERHAEALR